MPRGPISPGGTELKKVIAECLACCNLCCGGCRFQKMTKHTLMVASENIENLYAVLQGYMKDVIPGNTSCRGSGQGASAAGGAMPEFVMRDRE